MAHRFNGLRIFLPLVAVLLFLTCSRATWASGTDVFICLVGDYSHTNGFDNPGSVNGIRAFSVQTEACNQGDVGASWNPNTPEHPVIAQNMFRLRAGRFEQIGQAWVKHGFFAETESDCTTCKTPNPYDGTILGIGCCDTYNSSLNGLQFQMGPKSEVNASSGALPTTPCSGSCPEPDPTIGRRIQVAEADLDPTPAATYFMECQYVLPDDCQAVPRNDYNNASYRQIAINNALDLSSWIGNTIRGSPAIFAWGAADAGVTTLSVDVPNDGRYWIAAKATDLGAGQWHYEYAVHNLNSDRSGGAFTIPIAQGAVVSNIAFHGVLYHSGEIYDNTDWDTPAAGTMSATSMTWSSHPYPTAPANANALRWGTMYNFRFDANVPPATGPFTLGLFKSGSPASVSLFTVVPKLCLCNGDLNVDGRIDGRDIPKFVTAYLGAAPNYCADLAAPSGSIPDSADLAQFVSLLLAEATCP